jgi:hypothetical protein
MVSVATNYPVRHDGQILYLKLRDAGLGARILYAISGRCDSCDRGTEQSTSRSRSEHLCSPLCVGPMYGGENNAYLIPDFSRIVLRP